MYKKGDKVLLYTWEELLSIYGDNSGFLRNIAWNKWEDNNISHDRIITIEYIDDWGYGDIVYHSMNGVIYIPQKAVKCHVGEYYLQQIKDDINV